MLAGIITPTQLGCCILLAGVVVTTPISQLAVASNNIYNRKWVTKNPSSISLKVRKGCVNITWLTAVFFMLNESGNAACHPQLKNIKDFLIFVMPIPGNYHYPHFISRHRVIPTACKQRSESCAGAFQIVW